MKKISFFMFSLFILTKCYCDMQTLYMEKIYDNKKNCVKKYDYDRVYLKSSSIKLSKEQNYLQLNEKEQLPLVHLDFDTDGIFISLTNYNSDFWSIMICPGCGWIKRSDFPCGNPDCPRYGKQ